VIQINDMFRLQQTRVSNWGYTLWWLEEWQPTPYDTRGRWRAITAQLGTDSMDALLERMQCPVKAQAAFREAAGIAGPSGGLSRAGGAERSISLETAPP
jgi:hypothetical protein